MGGLRRYGPSRINKGRMGGRGAGEGLDALRAAASAVTRLASASAEPAGPGRSRAEVGDTIPYGGMRALAAVRDGAPGRGPWGWPWGWPGAASRSLREPLGLRGSRAAIRRAQERAIRHAGRSGPLCDPARRARGAEGRTRGVCTAHEREGAAQTRPASGVPPCRGRLGRAQRPGPVPWERQEPALTN